MSALAPHMTELDERVLALIPRSRPGVQASWIVATLSHTTRSREGVSLLDVRLILRGFEHLGIAQQRGGWWSR